jgi:hypothetical protein
VLRLMLDMDPDGSRLLPMGSAEARGALTVWYDTIVVFHQITYPYSLPAFERGSSDSDDSELHRTRPISAERRNHCSAFC